MISHAFLRDDGIVILRPQGPLEAADFQTVAAEIDPLIRERGGLRGLCIQAEKFPGWKDFHAFLAHLKFLFEHQDKFKKLAIVTDDATLARMPEIMGRFVHPQVKHFKSSEADAAMNWLKA